MGKNETFEEISDDRRGVLLHAAAKALGAVGVCVAIAVCTSHVTKSAAQSEASPISA